MSHNCGPFSLKLHHDHDFRELSMLPVISLHTVSCLVNVKTTYNKDPHKLK